MRAESWLRVLAASVLALMLAACASTGGSRSGKPASKPATKAVVVKPPVKTAPKATPAAKPATVSRPAAKPAPRSGKPPAASSAPPRKAAAPAAAAVTNTRKPTSPPPPSRTTPAPAAARAPVAKPAVRAAVPTRAPLPLASDADQDRIADTADLCPGSPAAFRVDARGCMVSQSFFLSDAHFEPGTALLTKPARKALDRLAIALKVQKDALVDIGGAYAGGEGDARFRGLVADARREALRQHFIKRGVLERRIAVSRDPARLPPRRGVRIRFVLK